MRWDDRPIAIVGIFLAVVAGMILLIDFYLRIIQNEQMSALEEIMEHGNKSQFLLCLKLNKSSNAFPECIRYAKSYNE